MILSLAFKHMDHSEAVRTYVEEKSEKLRKYFDGRFKMVRNFSKEKNVHEAHRHLLGRSMDFFGESEDDNLYLAMDRVSDKLDHQVKRKKEQLRNKVHSGGPHFKEEFVKRAVG